MREQLSAISSYLDFQNFLVKRAFCDLVLALATGKSAFDSRWRYQKRPILRAFFIARGLMRHLKQDALGKLAVKLYVALHKAGRL
ncbi:MAG: hypothetical protein ABSD52_14280 [Candidatus Cybelea sp.]|jgi:hypothetical protein